MNTRCRVDAVARDHRVDHLGDRRRLASAAPGVCRLEPVEAQVGVVGPALFGEQHRKVVRFGKLGPAAAVVVPLGRLGAAMEHDHQRARLGALRWRKEPGVQLAMVGPEIVQLAQTGRARLGSAGRPGGQAVDSLGHHRPPEASRLGCVRRAYGDGIAALQHKSDSSGRLTDHSVPIRATGAEKVCYSARAPYIGPATCRKLTVSGALRLLFPSLRSSWHRRTDCRPAPHKERLTCPSAP